MFDQPASLPLRAAIASLLGSLFGITMILVTHSSQAQTRESGGSLDATSTPAPAAPAARFGEAAARSLREAADPAIGIDTLRSRGLRITEGGNAPSSGLRWQVARIPGLRSEGEIPRGRDVISVGLQVRF